MKQTIKALIIRPKQEPQSIEFERSIPAIKALLECSNVHNFSTQIKLKNGNWRDIVLMFNDDATPADGFACAVVHDLLNVDTIFGNVIICGKSCGILDDITVTAKEIEDSSKVFWR